MDPVKTNRLAKEASPYLVQHSTNPVDWYPWGEEALAIARRFDRPILLSIGYSACHWCHVMERECFEDPDIAALMNSEFVCIKVDREERPDLDQIYQLVVQLLRHGGGGWPLTVFLASDTKPFFGGTYFPPQDRHGLPGFPRVLRELANAYRNRRGDIHEQSNDLVLAMTRIMSKQADEGEGRVGLPEVKAAVQKIQLRMDPEWGGFAGRPKFPNTMSLVLLLRAAVLEGDTAARSAVERALDGMRSGGIYDQLGYGFHRYSTDERWLVPHFEKMLYDNALLLRLYADAWKVFGHARYEQTAREIAEYVAREMTSADGAFYSAQDADSEGEEGKFFVFTKAEVEEVLRDDPQAAAVALLAYGVTAEGNFEHTAATVLSLARTNGEVATALGIDETDARAALERARKRLFEVRERRVRPFRDEKVLASWNGLLIGALAHAGASFGDEGLIVLAERALETVVRRLGVRGEGGLRLCRLYKDDVVRGQGLLDDYAYLADAALDLYEATGAPRHVTLAKELIEATLKWFADDEHGGFFFTPSDGETLLVRAKDLHDHAIPNAAAVVCRVLVRLGGLLGEELRARGGREIERFASAAVANPIGMGEALAAADLWVRGTTSVVVAGPHADPRVSAMARAAHGVYLPNRLIAWLDPSDAASRAACAELADGKSPAEPAAYVCRGFTCSEPIASKEQLAAALRA